ncbi:hypothetical protein [Microvirga antarctica]|uniref:hypothetical protein n=1 Tax=Microvirga antarctica TaxID=2819233 RepID=UPI001B3175EF|nr:hypothetical protein [Microvirga antarctica]
MRTVLILAAGLTVMATSAFSQPYSRDRDDAGRGGWYERRGDWERGREPDDRHGSASPSENEPDNDRGDGGARFSLRMGDTHIRVVCGDREPSRACVEAAILLLDRVKASAPASPPPPSPAGQ